jgi:hypothetical protein
MCLFIFVSLTTTPRAAGEPHAARAPHEHRRGCGARRRARRLSTRRRPEALSPRAGGPGWDRRSGACTPARGPRAAWGRPRPGTARAPTRGAAPAWPRTVCGPGEVARPQRITGASRGTRQPSGDSASRRVWGRHRGSVPGQGNQDRTRGESWTTPGPTRRKKTPKAALRGHRSLDNRGPHTGSARGVFLALRFPEHF